MSNEHITKAIDDFNRYFTSLNGVDVPARVSVPRDEWRALMVALRPAAQPVGEPVASIYISPNGDREFDDWKCALPVGRNILYTTPQPMAVPDRVPMTDEQVDAKCLTIQGHLLSRRDRDRAVWRLSEIHHGITTPKADK